MRLPLLPVLLCAALLASAQLAWAPLAQAQDAPPPSPDVETPDTQETPPPKPAPTPTPQPPPPTWQQQKNAILQVLDKVDGQSGTMTVAVGQKQVYRNITISVMSCYVRPPDQAQDATAYLVVQDNSQTTPTFVGWMLAAEPSLSLMEHPVYDVRVLGCK